MLLKNERINELYAHECEKFRQARRMRERIERLVGLSEAAPTLFAREETLNELIGMIERRDDEGLAEFIEDYRDLSVKLLRKSTRGNR